MSAFLSIGDAELEYSFIRNSPDRPTIVLLHEGLGCVEMWKDFPSMLAQVTGLNVFAYSRAGYGCSSTVDLPRPLNFHAREALEVLPAVLAKMKIKKHFILGHSDGASIGIIYGGSNLQLDLKGLILLAPHLAAEKKCVLQIQKAMSSFESGMLRGRLSKYHHNNTDVAFWGWSEVWVDPSFLDWNIEEHLLGINSPTLTLRGVDDPYNTDWHVKTISQRIIGFVEHHELPECGHAPHVDALEVVLNTIKKFVKKYQ
jgi:pimeloyl-ACP methyl ester carboxylesterase